MDNKSKGIILAGGSGTRLFPSTKSISKQILPVYDKPMIYYPLSTLMLAGVREILIISTPTDITMFKNLLGDGSHLGISISYAVQPKPGGIAEAFIIGKEFIDCKPCVLILGDNIFFGRDLAALIKQAIVDNKGATVFAYKVSDPERYGVVEFDNNKIAISIEEKPTKPKSNFAVTGLYIYNNEVCYIASSIDYSERNELEITDVNKFYLKNNSLNVQTMGRGFTWLDTGTNDSLLNASNFIASIQRKHGIMVSCLEEISYDLGYITRSELLSLAFEMKNSTYGNYLKKLSNINDNGKLSD